MKFFEWVLENYHITKMEFEEISLADSEKALEIKNQYQKSDNYEEVYESEIDDLCMECNDPDCLGCND